ncbi:MAG: hypothetical protein LBR12_02035 [Opitutaceae bacterium]|jgi:predicted RNase H-like HicB family nuclease|nr:hypothetical protein [Opitutaceae bacterium]
MAAARHPHLIEWDPADDCYIGSAPPLVGQCCHGATEVGVARQLSAIVEDLCEDVIDGKIPAPALPKENYSGVGGGLRVT